MVISLFVLLYIIRTRCYKISIPLQTLELERDSLKGLAKFTKKGELQSKIDRKNEEIDLLKIGLSGIAKRYGFKTVHDFYKTYAASKTAYAEYRNKADRWEELYGENKSRQKKAFTSGCRIIKKKAPTDNHNSHPKAEIEGRDNLSLCHSVYYL